MSTKGRGKRFLVVSGFLLLMILALTVWSSWDHVRFWWLFESLGKNEQGHPEYRHRDTGIVMVRVPGGKFMMGTPREEFGRDEDEGPVHTVTVSRFLLAKFEVTQEQWRSVTGDNPSKHRGDTHPVERISWTQCQEFCQETGLRLPTEAQWEYACRAGTKGAYGGTGKLAEMAWAGRKPSTAPVGQKLPNAFGLLDMHGNVEEWCFDIYDKDFYSKEASGLNPVCTSTTAEPPQGFSRRSDYRVIRGGALDGTAKEGSCRSGGRLSTFEDDKGEQIGFRPAYFPLP